MISNGAGTMVQAIDLLEQYGLEMPDLSPGTVARLTAALSRLLHRPEPDRRHRVGDQSRLRAWASRRCIDDPNVDIVMPWFVFQDTPLDEGIVEALAGSSRYDKPILCRGDGRPVHRTDGPQPSRRSGVPVFDRRADWVAAARGLRTSH